MELWERREYELNAMVVELKRKGVGKEYDYRSGKQRVV